MIRRKSLHSEAHPKYGDCDFNYTLRLKHGGMTLHDSDNIKYLGGTVSIFDFIDGKKWSLSYLSDLCNGLGYMGEKRFFTVQENGQLLALVTDEGVALVKKAAIKTREFTICLESEKNAENVFYALEGSDVDPIVEEFDEHRVGNEDIEGNEDMVEVRITNERHEELYESDFDLEYEKFNLELDEDYRSDEDEDFIYKSNSCDEEVVDDILYDEIVERDQEWIGLKTNEESDVVSYDSSSDNSGIGTDSDFNSIASDYDEDVEDREMIERSHGRNFMLGMKFGTKAQFKEDVTSYAVKVGRPCSFVKNDSRRIYAKCKKKDAGCSWHINVVKVKDESSFQIREMDLTHSCARQLHVSNAKSTWLAKRFETSFRCEPNRTAHGFRKAAMAELGVFISPQQAFRTRQKALINIEGSTTDQYTRLWDYADILRKKNPGSTIILQLDSTPNGRAFKSFYVCLQAVKSGFRSGCRPWIGVDGCHLSGANAGVLLSAVGMDPNNCPYPVAYAVVTVENKDTWEWFLTLLKDDLLTQREDIYCFMSDKQKGLIAAFEKVLPSVENRFCVLHLHSNMKRAGFRGDEYRKLLWKAAHATTVGKFNAVMEEIQSKDANLFAWLQAKPAREWSKSHFTTFGKCDTLVNNMCEQFNHAILDARDKPIITMLEWIRQYIMLRLQKNRDIAERKWEAILLCEKIRMILNKAVKESADCIPMKSTARRYEILSCDGSRCAVNLDEKTCDCRRWQLSGIPCKHAASAIAADGGEAETYVHNCYTVDTYNEVYNFAVAPMGGQEIWDKTGFIPPLPPAMLKKKKKGRHQKKRKLDASGSPKKKQSSNLQSLQKQKYHVKCTYCGESGHNRLGCKKRKEDEASSIKQTDVANKKTTTNAPSQKSPTDVCKFCYDIGHNVTSCVLRKQLESEVIEAEEEQVYEAEEQVVTQPEAEEQVVTQPDIFNETQEEEVEDQMQTEKKNSNDPYKPTTRKGRKLLARKRAAIANLKKRKTINNETKVTDAYSISKEVQENQSVEPPRRDEPIDPNYMKFKSTG